MLGTGGIENTNKSVPLFYSQEPFALLWEKDMQLNNEYMEERRKWLYVVEEIGRLSGEWNFEQHLNWWVGCSDDIF